MKLPAAYPSLVKNPNFLLFLLNCGLGSLGHGLTYISIAWLSQGGGSSLSAMALVMLGFWAPSVVLALPVGSFIDRGNERIAAILANALRGLLLIVVAIISLKVTFQPWHLFAVSLSLGTFNAFYGPSIGVLIRKLVKQEELLFANSMGDGFVEFFSILGMGISGFVLILIGLKATLLVAGALFIGAGLCFVFVKKNNGYYEADQLVPEKLDWQKVISTPKLVATYTMSGILFFLMMATPVLLAPYVRSLAVGSLTDFSLLEASFSLGAVVGAVFIPTLVCKNKTKILSFFWCMLSVSFMCFAFFPNTFLWHLSYIVIGIGIATWAVIHTEVQTLTPLKIQGRLLAYNNGIWGSLVFITFFLGNIWADSNVIRILYVAFSLLSLCLIVIYRLAVSPREAPTSSQVVVK